MGVSWRITGNLVTWPEFMTVTRESDGKKLQGGHMWTPSREDDKCPICGEVTKHTKGKEEYNAQA